MPQSESTNEVNFAQSDSNVEKASETANNEAVSQNDGNLNTEVKSDDEKPAEELSGGYIQGDVKDLVHPAERTDDDHPTKEFGVPEVDDGKRAIVYPRLKPRERVIESTSASDIEKPEE